MTRKIATWHASYYAALAAWAGRDRRGHLHEFVQHPNLDGFIACRICGFATKSSMVLKSHPERIVFND